MNHGDPVNAVICMPGGGLLISAGGNEIKVWDYESVYSLSDTDVDNFCDDDGGY